MNSPNYAAIWYFVSRYKLRYAIILAVALPVSVLEGLGIAAFLPLFSNMLGNTPANLGGFAGFAINIANLIPVSSTFVAAVLFLIVIFVAKTLGILGRELLMAHTGAKILYSVKKEIMARYAGAKYQFMVDSQQGSLIYIGLAAPNAVSNLHLTLLRGLTAILKVAAITVVLVSLMPIISAAFISLGVVYYLVIHYISRKVSYYIGVGRVDALSRLNVIANEFLNGFRQITAFNISRIWEANFDKENRTYSELYAKDLSWQAVPRPLLELSALGLLLGAVLFLKATSSDTFTEDLAAFGVFAVAVVQLLPSVNTIGGTRIQMMTNLPDVQIAHQVLTQSVPARQEGHLELPSFKEAIIFEDVSFAHKDRETLMDKVNMTFERGKITAIVGPSGSGKTTLINLILGLFEPSGGRITVDGTPLQDLTHESWLGRIGFVSQDPFIYNTTIEENIRFSRSEHSKEEVVQASAIANAHQFIADLPQGYDTLVGDRGVRLSGGQLQRICIARAVLDAPDILIFDEATSSLDSVSEQQVQRAIDNASADRTVIIIAHRLSTVRHADKIIVLDEGKIVEEGTHQELLSRNGEYASMVSIGS